AHSVGGSHVLQRTCILRVKIGHCRSKKSYWVLAVCVGSASNQSRVRQNLSDAGDSSIVFRVVNPVIWIEHVPTVIVKNLCHCMKRQKAASCLIPFLLPNPGQLLG